ncbi:LGFP repeat-containing protein [Litorihabitans aurantiacus]|uniref:LGFP repeat-containing protein n=1 Tax=Litorihabitans aurantiacus TaxID=1930061 RepID=UPI0024E09AFF|nr:hypothetical protein [Litorihabitans aurantiacus]
MYDSPHGRFLVRDLPEGWRSIADEHAAHGGGRGALGYPVDRERSDTADPWTRERTFQRFERGIVYRGGWTATTLYRSPITQLHLRNGGGGGWLNYPVTNEITQGSQHRYQEFRLTVLYDSPSGTYVTAGNLMGLHRGLGGGRTVGYPTGPDTVQAPGYRFQTFERTTIYCFPHPYTGREQCSDVSGTVRRVHDAHGGGTGSLGYPMQRVVQRANGDEWQLFERGSISVSPSGATVTYSRP